MRKRINRAAICSSENYRASKRAHKVFLEESHRNFNLLAISEKINCGSIPHDHPPKWVVIKVWGKLIQITYSEYLERCSGFEITKE